MGGASGDISFQLSRFAPVWRFDGAGNHCQSGALAYKDEVVFNWIAERLGREPVS